MPSVKSETQPPLTKSPKSPKMGSLEERRFTFSDLGSSKYLRRASGLNCLANIYDYVVKIILLGDQGVGKTSFLKALQVHPDVTKATCRCSMGPASDHLEVEVTTSVGKTMLVRLCDTGGQERYRSLTSSYYRGAHGVILMFDVNNSKSMDNIELWLSDLDNFSSTAACTRVLLGSNCASNKRVVSSHEARRYAESRSLPYMEVDTTQFYNVVETMELVANSIAKHVDVPSPSTSVIKPSLTKDQTPTKKQFTCLC